MSAPPTAKVCPCCGTDIELDVPILINDFSMLGANWPLAWKEKPLKLSNGEAMICWSLMKAYPSHLSIVAIAERVTSEELEEPDNLVRVLISRIRKKLREAGAPDPIETVHLGYRWNPRATA